MIVLGNSWLAVINGGQVYSYAVLAYKHFGGPDDAVYVNGNLNVIFRKVNLVFLKIDSQILLIFANDGDMTMQKDVMTMKALLVDSRRIPCIV